MAAHGKAVQKPRKMSAADSPPARRQPAAKVLEIVTQRIEPEEKVCPHCGKTKCEIGCEKSGRFEYAPAKIIRHETLRPKLACPCGQGTVNIAPLPPSVIPQGQPGPGLVAHVLLSKYDDHLPLYRQQQQFERLGVNFPRQTLFDWVEKGAEWLQPIVREMRRALLAGDYLQVEETPVRVMDPGVRGRCATGYLWVAGRPNRDVIFEFHPGRGKEFAQHLLGNFQGYLRRDGYGVNGALAREQPALISLGCWSHARRKFVDAVEERPREAGEIVTELRKLYLIERHARDECLEPAQRGQVRADKSAPILAALKPRLETLWPGCLPQSPPGEAIHYALAEWEPLNHFLQDGRLEIDNNLTYAARGIIDWKGTQSPRSTLYLSRVDAHRSCAFERPGAVSGVGHLPHQRLAGGFDAEELRPTTKPVLKAENHAFQRTSQISEPFHAIGVKGQKPFRAKQSPLDDMYQFVEV
jgi:transposase